MTWLCPNKFILNQKNWKPKVHLICQNQKPKMGILQAWWDYKNTKHTQKSCQHSTGSLLFWSWGQRGDAAHCHCPALRERKGQTSNSKPSVYQVSHFHPIFKLKDHKLNQCKSGTMTIYTKLSAILLKIYIGNSIFFMNFMKYNPKIS